MQVSLSWFQSVETYVTVHAKTSLVCIKIGSHFFTPLHTLATCTACLPWPDSVGLLFWGVDLQPCKAMTGTLAPVERATSLGFYPRPEWCPLGLVEWSGPSEGDWWLCVFTWEVFLLPPHPYLPLPTSHPPTPL